MTNLNLHENHTVEKFEIEIFRNISSFISTLFLLRRQQKPGEWNRISRKRNVKRIFQRDYIHICTKGTINQDACYQKPPSRFR